MGDYYQLSDAEWEWVASFLEDRNAPSAYALRGYLNDRITERLVTARAEDRARKSQRITALSDLLHEPSTKKHPKRRLPWGSHGRAFGDGYTRGLRRAARMVLDGEE